MVETTTGVKHPTTKREHLALMTEARRLVRQAPTPEEREAAQAEYLRLRDIYRKTRAAQRAGETAGFDTAASQVPVLSQEELEAVWDEINAPRELVSEVERLEDARRVGASPLALDMPTFELLHFDDQGIPQLRLIEERSVPRDCLAAFVNVVAETPKIYAERVVIYLPTGFPMNASEELCKELNIPFPAHATDLQHIERFYDGKRHLWQRERQLKRLRRYCEARGLLPVAADPESSHPDYPGIAVATITCANREFALELASRGDTEGLGQLHYISGFFSGVALDEGEPDFRIVRYAALDKEEMSTLFEFLGLGTFESDGSSPFIIRPSTPEQVLRDAHLQGRTPPQDPEAAYKWAEAIAERDNKLKEHFFQDRMTELDEEENLLWFAKGTKIPMGPELLEEKLRAHEELITIGEAEAFAGLTGAMLSGDKDAEREALGLMVDLDALKQKYLPTTRLIKWVLKQVTDTVLLVKGDQIKMNADRATRGAALMAGTWLRGQTHHNLPRYHTTIGGTCYKLDAAGESQVVINTSNSRIPVIKRKGDKQPRLEIIQREGVASCVVHEEREDRLKPTQYRVRGNTQILQFLDHSATRGMLELITYRLQHEIIDNLTTPAGWMKIVDDAEAARRQRIDLATARFELDGVVVPDKDKEDVTLEDVDLLRKALHTNLVRLDTDGLRLLLDNKPVPAGHMQVPSAILGRFDSITAARIRHIMRSYIELYGYLNVTGPNSINRWRQLNALERICTYDAYRDAEGDMHEEVEIPPAGAFLDPSIAFVPKFIAQMVNGDDDGDFFNGVSAILSQPDGRLYKVVLLMRYPCVDSPVLWVLPPEVPTPYDAADAYEAKLFARFIQLFLPEDEAIQLQLLHLDGEDKLTASDITEEERVLLYGDNIIIAKSPHVERFGLGAKAQFDKTKLQGPVNIDAAIGLIDRKLRLNNTGRYTRKQERFAVLIALAKDHIREGIKEFGETPRVWDNALDLYCDAAAEMMLGLELELTGFKYDTAPFYAPKLFLEEEDPWIVMMESDRELSADMEGWLKDMIPLKYHLAIESIHHVLARYERDERFVALERMRKVPGEGKETAVVNLTLRRAIHGKGGVIDILSAVKTDMGPFVTDITKRLKEIGGEETPTDTQDRRKVMAAVSFWRQFWDEVNEVRERRLSKAHPDRREEIAEEVAAFTQHASAAVRYKMRRVAASVSERALMAQVASYFKQQAVRRQRTHDQRSSDEETAPRVSSAAVLALIEDRLVDVFKPVNLNLTVLREAEHKLLTFTRGVDLPGVRGALITPDDIIRVEKRTVVERGDKKLVVPKGAFMMRIENEFIPLYIAEEDQEKAQDPNLLPPAGAELRIVKMHNRRAELRW